MTREEAGRTGEGYLWPVRQDEDPCPIFAAAIQQAPFAAKSLVK
jgi:hypothetical protein